MQAAQQQVLTIFTQIDNFRVVIVSSPKKILKLT